MSNEACTQNISIGTNDLFLNYLDNCVQSKIYPPLRLYEDDTFVYINGADNRQASWQKDCPVIINGDTYPASNLNEAILAVITEIGKVNSSASSMSFMLQTAKVYSNEEELAADHEVVNDEIVLDNYSYFFDSRNFELVNYTLYHSEDVHLFGFSQGINKLSSSKDNIALIRSDNANLFISNLVLEATGTGSECINMLGDGTTSLDMNFVEMKGVYGTLDNIRQLFWVGGFSMSAPGGFTIENNISGIAIRNTRVINTAGYLIKGAVGSTIGNIRTNINATIPTGGFAFDVDYDMLPNDGSIQVEGARFDGNGDISAPLTDAGRDSDNLWESRKSLFLNNRGEKAKNTLIGAYWELTTEAVTAITQNVEVKIAGTTTFNYSVHFSKNTENSIRSSVSFEETVKVDGFLRIKGGANDALVVLLKKRIDATGLYETIAEYPATVNNLSGANDVAILTIFRPFVSLAESDDIELWIKNTSSNDDITLEIGSYLALHK